MTTCWDTFDTQEKLYLILEDINEGKTLKMTDDNRQRRLFIRRSLKQPFYINFKKNIFIYHCLSNNLYAYVGLEVFQRLRNSFASIKCNFKVISHVTLVSFQRPQASDVGDGF